MILNDKDIETLTAMELIFRTIQDQYGTPPSWQRPPGFVSLCKIILEQQVSLASAAAHYNALEKFIHTVSPENILKLSAEEFKTCYISRQKASCLIALSEAVVNGSIQFHEHQIMTDEEIRLQLTSIKGIGNWTADVYLMMCLQRKNIFPIGDIALQQAAKKLFALSSKEDIIILAEHWKPYRSLAGFFLWHWYLCSKKKGTEY